jgi:hypothetical protein
MMNALRPLVLVWLVSIGLVVCTLPSGLLAAEGRVQGQVTNGTLGKPASGQQVQLLLPRGGMQQVARALTDADGLFVFPQSDIDPNSFYLLQTVYQGVNYNAPVQFGSNGAATVNLVVYESTQTEPAVRIQSARVLVRAAGNKARVQELFAIRNPSNPPRSYVNPDGTFHFRLSPTAGEPSAAVAGLMNMPLPQPVQPGKSPGEFSLQYPLKPGLTVAMIAYDLDYSAGRVALDDAVPYPIDRVELFVSPLSIAVGSALFKPAGTDSETGSQKFEAVNVKGGAALEAQISGEAGPETTPQTGQSEIKVEPNPITRMGVPLLVCFLLVMLWALGVRVAKEWPRWKGQRESNLARKELKAQAEGLFNSLADLDELFAAGKIAENQYWKERLDLKARLVATLRKAPPSLLESYATRHTPG